MKLKKWVEIILLIISSIAFIAITYDMEKSMIPFIIGTLTLMITIPIISTYGSIGDMVVNYIKETLQGK